MASSFVKQTDETGSTGNLLHAVGGNLASNRHATGASSTVTADTTPQHGGHTTTPTSAPARMIASLSLTSPIATLEASPRPSGHASAGASGGKHHHEHAKGSLTNLLDDSGAQDDENRPEDDLDVSETQDAVGLQSHQHQHLHLGSVGRGDNDGSIKSISSSVNQNHHRRTTSVGSSNGVPGQPHHPPMREWQPPSVTSLEGSNRNSFTTGSQPAQQQDLSNSQASQPYMVGRSVSTSRAAIHANSRQAPQSPSMPVDPATSFIVNTQAPIHSPGPSPANASASARHARTRSLGASPIPASSLGTHTTPMQSSHANPAARPLPIQAKRNSFAATDAHRPPFSIPIPTYATEQTSAPTDPPPQYEPPSTGHQAKERDCPSPPRTGASSTDRDRDRPAAASTAAHDRERDRPNLRGESPAQFVDRMKRSTARREWGSMICGKGEFFQACREYFMQDFRFEGMSLDLALRKLLLELSLPKEAQQIERLVESFAQFYHAQNPDVFPDAKVPDTIVYSMIFIHTMMYNQHGRRQHRGVDHHASFVDGLQTQCRLPKDLLEAFFENLKAAEYVLADSDTPGAGELHADDYESRVKLRGGAAGREMYKMVRDGPSATVFAQLSARYGTLFLPTPFQSIAPPMNRRSGHQGGGGVGSLGSEEYPKVMVPNRPKKLLRKSKAIAVQGGDGKRVPVSVVKRGSVTRIIEIVDSAHSTSPTSASSRSPHGAPLSARRRTWFGGQSAEPDTEQWYLVITPSQLLCWQGKHKWANTVDWTSGKGETPAPSLVLSTRDAVAVYDLSVHSTNSFRVVLHVPQVKDQVLVGVQNVDAAKGQEQLKWEHKEYLFQTYSEADMWDWIEKFNSAAALRTAGVHLGALKESLPPSPKSKPMPPAPEMVKSAWVGGVAETSRTIPTEASAGKAKEAVLIDVVEDNASSGHAQAATSSTVPASTARQVPQLTTLITEDLLDLDQVGPLPPSSPQRPTSAPATNVPGSPTSQTSTTSVSPSMYFGMLHVLGSPSRRGSRPTTASSVSSSVCVSISSTPSVSVPQSQIAGAHPPSKNGEPASSSWPLDPSPPVSPTSSEHPSSTTGNVTTLLLTTKRAELSHQAINASKSRASLQSTFMLLSSAAPYVRSTRRRIVESCHSLAARIRALAIEQAMANAYVDTIDRVLGAQQQPHETRDDKRQADVDVVEELLRQAAAEAVDKGKGTAAATTIGLVNGPANLEAAEERRRRGDRARQPTAASGLSFSVPGDHPQDVPFVVGADAPPMPASPKHVLLDIESVPASPVRPAVSLKPLPDDAPIVASSPALASRLSTMVNTALVHGAVVAESASAGEHGQSQSQQRSAGGMFP
ncbi:hypothetical protein BCR44DRAFT_34126 [Catenaria anguillulae PL171]|uniref:SEC7 domain-containing protein n=1 Tax=Catenaria anguillulae PL171 TaxID=765915 RepID=A0A1Y2HX43_9FUNG|nr:hypothetical protein BCR44DRAFT_34126 [Catenaria anguillulae PL171]